jgi:hypothetical protein
MIGRYYGVSTSCNLCNKLGPMTRFDHRYTSGLPENQYYVDQINATVEKEAMSEGFVRFGEANNIKHFCPVCAKDLAVMMAKAEKSKKKILTFKKKAIFKKV